MIHLALTIASALFLFGVACMALILVLAAVASIGRGLAALPEVLVDIVTTRPSRGALIGIACTVAWVVFVLVTS